MNNYEGLIIWIVATISVWTMWSGSVVSFVDKVKPTYDTIFGVIKSLYNDLFVKDGQPERQLRGIRNALIIIAVYAMGYLTASELDYNVVEGAPTFIRRFVSDDFSLYLTAGWLTFGAFLFHNAGDWLTEKRNNS